MPHLDELDTALLRELQHDARRTNRDLAEAIGVAPSTALDRTRSLRERGVIRGALLDVDLAAIGRPVQALIAVRIRPPSPRARGRPPPPPPPPPPQQRRAPRAPAPVSRSEGRLCAGGGGGAFAIQ